MSPENEKKHRISVFIITRNEQDNIENCLRSVKWADEIVVVDSESSDRTDEICRKYTDKVFVRSFTDFSDMKNYAMSKTTGDWLLSVDADEEVSGELAGKIDEIINNNSENSGFYIKRQSRIFGRWFRFCGTQDDYQMRLFRQGAANFFQPIHEKVSINGKTARIEEPLLHYTYNSMRDYMVRLKKYTAMEAKFISSEGGKPSLIKLLLHPPARFLQLYVLKQGFRDGLAGFKFSFLSGLYVYLKHIKLYKTNI